MNIKDIKLPDETPDNVWKEIFDKQASIARKYAEIEGMQEILKTLDTNLDTREGQKWIKDFAWRTTEELTEAREAERLLDRCPAINYDERFNLRTHYIEELIDALHFIVEMAILCGYTEKDFDLKVEYYTSSWNLPIYYLGLACNCLKNKPWKQSDMLTDRVKFKDYFTKAFLNLRWLLLGNVLDDLEIYSYYFKKNEVNQFRIRSKY